MKKYILGLILFSVSAHAQFQIPRLIFNASKPASAETDSRTTLSSLPTKESDAAIEKALRDVAAQTEWFNDLRITVNAGTVKLEGKVAHKYQLEWLQQATERLPGVLAIIDGVTTNPPSLTDLAPLQRELRNFANRAQRFFPLGLLCLFVFIGTFFASRFLNRRVTGLWKSRIDNPFLLTLVSRATLLPAWILVFYLIFRALGLSTLGATLIGGTGVLSIVLGLALRGIVENYLAGLLLASRSPFTKGDLIKINGYQGYVQNLNMRGTTIVDPNGNLILIPNLTVIQSIVENHTANPNTRTSFDISVGYEDSIEAAQNLILEAMKEVKGVLENPAPSVVVDSLSRAGANLRVQVWFNIKTSNEMRVRSRAILRAKETLLSHGMSMPDEVREVVFKDTVKVQLMEQTQEATPSQDRKDRIQKQATVNLAYAHETPLTRDTPPEELLQQADQNPLPVNKEHTDLLKKK